MRGRTGKGLLCLMAMMMGMMGVFPGYGFAEGGKEVIIYFANWNLNGKAPTHGGEVIGLPWDSVTCINHAFWKAAPAEGEAETSWARRSEGKEPRTEFTLVSTNPADDLEDMNPSALEPAVARNHFAEYAYMKEQHPEVKVLISVGGWSDCGFFSEMAYTSAGRASFIASCVSLMREYPWIDGIDIDWEYPGGSNDGERKPEGEGDDGCPIWGTQYEDRQNCTALFQEMREAFDTAFGTGEKMITACVSASVSWTLPNQDWASPAPYVDRYNLMSYDLAGRWDGVTGHASTASAATRAFMELTKKGIPGEKISYGTPLYSTIYKIAALSPLKQAGVGIDRDFAVNGDTITQDELRALEEAAVSRYETLYQDGEYVKGGLIQKEGLGWHQDYDSYFKSPYLWNDDPDSPYYSWYISYENPVSLQHKLKALEKNGAAGIIVWEASQDTADWQMIRHMYAWLHR